MRNVKVLNAIFFLSYLFCYFKYSLRCTYYFCAGSWETVNSVTDYRGCSDLVIKVDYVSLQQQRMCRNRGIWSVAMHDGGVLLHITEQT